MDRTEAQLLRHLITDQRVLSLAVVVEGRPVVGLLPFAAAPDLTGAYVLASRLARHWRGLAAGSPFGVLIHRPVRPTDDARQVPRVSLDGVAEPLPRDAPAHAGARARYLEKHPESEMLFGLGDFDLVALRFRSGRLVDGFARAFNLTEETLRRAAAAE